MHSTTYPFGFYFLEVHRSFPFQGGASGLQVSAVGALKTQRTEGPPASAVLQADTMRVGLDSEADRCQLERNHIT